MRFRTQSGTGPLDEQLNTFLICRKNLPKYNKAITGEIEMNEKQNHLHAMSDSVRMRLATGLLLLVVSVLLLPVGVVLRDSLAGAPAANGFTIAADTISDSVTATPAEFRVDESGAATYSIPLFTVSGTAGVVPKLSLSYSSQGNEGPLGKGWAIGGLSAISRCRATRESGDFIVSGVATDGNPAPVNFMVTDRYCLDGQRLLPADDAAACPTVSGMTVENLRTELQSFQRVCAYTPSGGTAGVAFFTVERKDGSTSWYGDRDNSLTANRADGYVNSTAPGKEAFALSWAQTRFQDSTGNYIDYLYSEGAAPDNPGEHLISKVRYTGKSVLAGQAGSAKLPYAEVTFNYNGSFFDSRAYVAGGLIRSRSQLQSITSSVDHDNDGSFTSVRHYVLSYLRGRSAQVLTSLQECRDATQQVCAASTAFEWSAARANEADTNLFQTWEPTAAIPNGSLTKFEGMKFGDIDGDGRQDMVWLKDGSSGDACVSKQVNLLYSRLDGNGSPTLQNAGMVFCAPNGLYWSPQDYSWFLLDYDGDGRDDYFQRTDTVWIGYRATGNAAQPFDTSVNLLAGLAQPIPSGADKYSEPQQADINGDGLLDLVYPSGSGLVARIMERGGSYGFQWGAPRTVSLIGDGCSSGPCYAVTGLYRKNNYQQLNDFNADARSDLIVNVQSTCGAGGGPGGGDDPGGGGVQQRVQETRDTATRAATTAATTTTCPIGVMFTVDTLSATSVVLKRYSDRAFNPEWPYSFADINGDGLTDVVFMGNAEFPIYSASLNTGTGFVGNGQTSPIIVGYQYAQLTDINGDGRADYIYPNSADGQFLALRGLSSGEFAPAIGLGSATTGCTTNTCQSGRSHQFVDIDGDGNVEYMRIKWDNDSSSPVAFSRANPQNRFIARDVLVRVTNGFGAQTDIAYAPLTLKDLYRPETGTRNAVSNWGRGSPVQDMFGPMYVAHRVSSTSAQNGDPAAKATVYYRYNGAKLQAGGRGFLGFRDVVAIDPNQTGGYVTTTTQYAQNFPFVGVPLQTVKRAAINQLYVPSPCLNGAPSEGCFAPRTQPGAAPVGSAFSQSTQSWEAVGANGAVFNAGTQVPVYARTAGTVEAVADPFTATQTSWVATAFTYGANGNVLQTSVDTYPGTSGTPISTITTNNAYTDDTSTWRLGRLTGSTVTHKRPGMPDVVRSTWFGYAMTGPKTGLLVEERIQPTVDVRQDLRKVYNLDDYGNRVASFVCSQQVADCRSTNLQYNLWQWDRIHRYSRQEYDDRGRFPLRTIELFRPATAATIDTTQPVEMVTSEVLARDEYGNVTEVVGLNNVRSVARFGTLGRAYYAWQQTDPAGTVPNANGTVGMSSLTTFRWCNTGNGSVVCPARAKFRVKTTATASPTQWVYYDLLGREVLKVSQSFNAGVSGKDASGVCIEYDAVGRAYRTSTPFFLAGTTGAGEPDVANVCTAVERKWATTEFDVLGRPVKTVEANNAVSTMAYSNSTTTATNARLYTKVEIKNALGELVQATDAAGLSTFYAYDAAGNLGAVTRDGGRGAITTSMGYDALGRKIFMNDPDAGVRYLGYNAAGEQEIEHDGAGNINYSRYDFRGRVTWRASYAQTANGQVQEHSSSTNFDTTSNGIGQEHCSWADGFAYAAWQGQSDKTQVWSRCNSFDSMGRPIASATYIDGVAYSSAVSFDLLSRPQKSQDPSGKWLKTEFGARGQALRLCESSAADASATCAPGVATTYLENQETDVFGNMVRDTRGGLAAMQTFKQYDPLTGRLSEICAGASSTNCTIMRDRYVWDSVGNLNWRDRKDYGEDFWYDSVDRLQLSRVNRVGTTTYASGTGQITDWADYDKLGNVCAHWMRGAQSTGYFYAGRAACGLNGSLGSTINASQTESPHQVRQTSAYSNFVYDAHGNQTFADSAASDSLDRTIRYTAQDQAYEIFKGTAAAPNRMARFWYDPSGSRYKREDSGLGIVGTRRTLYVGNLEIVSENGTTTYKRYIGGVLVQNVVNGIAANRYLFTDHIGSVIATTNETGAVLEGGGFNAFGERRTNGSATGITTTGLASTTRGFTGHEMLDDGLDVIHMNGRIYDPTLGRFLQADPVIQSPETPQGWNAYSYVFNNPYRYTDPTGMIGLEERQWLGAAVAIVATVLAPAAGLFVSTAAATSAATLAVIVVGGAIGGGIAGGSQGAVMGAFTSVLGMAGGGNFLSSAFVGGVSSALQGGSFGSGFFSAGVVAMSAPGIAKIGSATGKVAVRALVGGTVSALTGGKFANGAAMAAFQGVLQEGITGIDEEEDQFDTGGRAQAESFSQAPEYLRGLLEDPSESGRQDGLKLLAEHLGYGMYVDRIYYVDGVYKDQFGVYNEHVTAVVRKGSMVFFKSAFNFGYYGLASIMDHESIHMKEYLAFGPATDPDERFFREVRAYSGQIQGANFWKASQQFRDGQMNGLRTEVRNFRLMHGASVDDGCGEGAVCVEFVK